MNAPTFVLCVGAQKSGTTWLHRYVSSAEGAARPLMKEFQVWNTLYPGRDEPQIAFEGKAAAQRHELHRTLVDNPERYFAYFADLFARTGASIASDMSPSYAGLPVEAFERIRDGFDTVGVTLRIVFLMRDPVERCWSAVRMYRRKGLPLPGLTRVLDEQEAQSLVRYCRTDHAQRHGRYDRTVNVLERVFPAEQIFFGFYERLFEPASIDSLSKFLGIETRAGLAAEQHNVSLKDIDLSTGTRRSVAEAYAPALAYCWDRFPVTRELWTSYADLS